MKRYTRSTSTSPGRDRLERRHEQPFEPLEWILLGRDDLLVAVEQPVQEAAQHLVDHLFFGREVVVQTAGQDAGRIRDVAHRRRPQAPLGEHLRGEPQELVASGVGRSRRTLSGHGCWLDTEITSPVR
jgi:hypothetical protein